MPIRLHINIDHVATLRNARGTRYPDPIEAAFVCERAGADGITAHLREDRRHMTDRDIERLRESIATLLNLEMAATDEMVAIAERIKPDVITLVPERREERTTEGGLDVVGQRERIAAIVARARAARIRVSLFIAPEEAQVRASADLKVDQIELHTGEYCNAVGEQAALELERLRTAAALGATLGLDIAAGHGLTRANTPAVAAIPQVSELNIGHSILADAVFSGIGQAVIDMRESVLRGIALRP
ncbi:MAG: pyridoxine 5'-phosphate synthase [Deltaproteobacteria bacterium]|nr:pyridoxine 5'-phosphate synthase [Deltaproteobacteria bacterium]